MIRLLVKEVAKGKGYNMSSLSRATNLSFYTIKRLWTKPEEGVNLHTLAIIARVLDVPVSSLYEETPD